MFYILYSVIATLLSGTDRRLRKSFCIIGFSVVCFGPLVVSHPANPRIARELLHTGAIIKYLGQCGIHNAWIINKESQLFHKYIICTVKFKLMVIKSMELYSFDMLTHMIFSLSCVLIIRPIF